MERDGKTQPLESLVDAHYQSLYGFAFRLSGSRADAEDLTQETFCILQLKIGQLRKMARVKSWLFRVLRNLYLHRLRQAKPTATLTADQLEQLPEREIPSTSILESGELQHVLGQLPEEFRTPLILYYFAEMSYRSISEHLDIPMGTVMSRLSRAKFHLRSRLEHRHEAMFVGADKGVQNGLSCRSNSH